MRVSNVFLKSFYFMKEKQNKNRTDNLKLFYRVFDQLNLSNV